jgi:plasmid stability protein
MPTREMVAVRLPGDIKNKLKLRAKQHNRTITNQLESYIKVSLIAEDNPDLPFSFIQDILEAEEERKAGLGVPFEFKVKK